MQKIKKYKIKQLILIICFIMFCFSLITVLGRYITNSMNNFFVRSKEFYFYSDKLAEDNSAIYQIDNWSGVDDYIITINMNSRKNNIQVASDDIEYNITYTCSDNAICQLNKKNGVINANSNADFFNLTITPNRQLDTGDKVVVEIEVDSKGNYKKKLKGRFTLVVGKEKITYQITDAKQKPYMELRITNTLSYYIVKEAFEKYYVGEKIDSETYLNMIEENRKKCYSALVTIEFDPKKVLLDVTNQEYLKATNVDTIIIDGKTYIKKLTVSLEAISSKDIRFYKTDISKDYTYPNGNGTSILKITSK